MRDPRTRPPFAESRLLDPRMVDPRQELVNYSAMDDAEIDQIVRVLQAIRRWREAEQRASVRSRRRMDLNENDMKALRFLVVCKNEGIVATPGALAEHLAISSASTTKLLDRLSAAGHVERAPHPSDRRALMVTITQPTHERVRDTVGRAHARRFDAAASMTPDEREVVIRFLNELSDASEPHQNPTGTAQGDEASSPRVPPSD